MKWSLLILFALLALQTVYPGDVPWINDEPRLISHALEANRLHQLASSGLQGTVGVAYGPLPTWIYQGLLLLTPNLIWIVWLKTLVTGLCLLFCAILLQKTTHLRREPLFLIFLSPFLYFYGRLPWDNCFLIPLTAVLFTFFVRFSKSPTSGGLLGITVTAWALIQTHLMSLMLLFPLAVLLVVWHRDFLRRRFYIPLLGVVGCLPYALSLGKQIPPGGGHVGFHPWDALGSTLMGFRLFSFGGFFSYFLPEASPPKILVFATMAGSLAGIWGVICGIRGLAAPASPLHKKIDALCLAALGTTFLFFSFLKVGNHPHYTNVSG